jgi:hypothetical protein
MPEMLPSLHQSHQETDERKREGRAMLEMGSPSPISPARREIRM